MDTVSAKDLTIIDNGNYRPIHHVAAVDRIFESYKKKGFWETIDTMMKVWEEINPGAWRELIVEVQNTRDDLVDKRYATTGKQSRYMERRLLLRMPDFVCQSIMKLYPDEPMDRKFYNKFARRYPAFRVSEKI